MPRKGPAVRRGITPDPVYQNPLVTQLVNKVLLHGKKTVAEHIVYEALEQISQKTANDPVITLKRAVENVRPMLEVKSRRVGGASYQVPVEVKPNRGTTLALRWLVNFSRARRENSMQRLPNWSELSTSAIRPCLIWRSLRNGTVCAAIHGSVRC